MVLALVVAALLVVWNTSTNLLGLPRRWYAPAGLSLTGALLATALLTGSSWEDVGFGWPQDMRWSAVVVTAVAIAITVGAALSPHVGWIRGLLHDRRADLDGTALVREAFLRIPVGTALVEETAFRGVLMALLLRELTLGPAVFVMAVTFGLWHIGPTIVALRLNRVDPTSRDGFRRIGVAVVATAVAGAGFAALRSLSGGLLAPIIAHWSINAFGLLAAAVVQQGTDSVPGGIS